METPHFAHALPALKRNKIYDRYSFSFMELNRWIKQTEISRSPNPNSVGQDSQDGTSHGRFYSCRGVEFLSNRELIVVTMAFNYW